VSLGRSRSSVPIGGVRSRDRYRCRALCLKSKSSLSISCALRGQQFHDRISHRAGRGMFIRQRLKRGDNRFSFKSALLGRGRTTIVPFPLFISLAYSSPQYEVQRHSGNCARVLCVGTSSVFAPENFGRRTSQTSRRSRRCTRE
jgi:hypothetical protein